MGVDDFTLLVQQAPYIAALLFLSLYFVRSFSNESSAWREHERLRDDKRIEAMEGVQQEIHRLMVILVLHHSSTLDGKVDSDTVLNYIKSGFSPPQTAGVSVQ